MVVALSFFSRLIMKCHRSIFFVIFLGGAAGVWLWFEAGDDQAGADAHLRDKEGNTALHYTYWEDGSHGQAMLHRP